MVELRERVRGMATARQRRKYREKQRRQTVFVLQEKKETSHLDVGQVVGPDLDVDDATGRLAHDRAAVLETDDRAVVADEALDLPGESRAGGRDEGGAGAHQAAPRRDGCVVVLFRERGVEQRADGGVVRGGGRHGRRDAHELFRADKEGRRVVLGDDELDVGGGRGDRGGQGHEGCHGEGEEGELGFRDREERKAGDVSFLVRGPRERKHARKEEQKAAVKEFGPLFFVIERAPRFEKVCLGNSVRTVPVIPTNSTTRRFEVKTSSKR